MFDQEIHPNSCAFLSAYNSLSSSNKIGYLCSPKQWKTSWRPWGWAGTSFDFLAGLQLLRFLTVDKRPLTNGCGVPGIPTSLQNILQPRGVGWRGCVADNNYKRWRIVDPLILLEAHVEPEATIWNYSLHVDWSIESSVSLHKECRATPTFVHLWLKYFQGESICSWSISQVDQGRSQCRVASIYW